MKRVTAWLIIVVAVGACAPAQDRGSAAPERASEDNPYRFETEGKIPPPEDVRPEADVEEMPVDESAVVVEEAPIPVDTTSQQTVMIDGFRVQLFASGTKETAEFARRTAAERLGVPVYVEQENGTYKVRAGDCATRAEAEALRAKCQAGYYKDAWIVATKVLATGGR